MPVQALSARAVGLKKPKGLTMATEDITDSECHFSSEKAKVDPAIFKLFFSFRYNFSPGWVNQGTRILFSKYPLPILKTIDQTSCLAASGNKVVTRDKVVSHFRNRFYSTNCQTESTFWNEYPVTVAWVAERPGVGRGLLLGP